jgi:hypothetical protein
MQIKIDVVKLSSRFQIWVTWPIYMLQLQEIWNIDPAPMSHSLLDVETSVDIEVYLTFIVEYTESEHKKVVYNIYLHIFMWKIDEEVNQNRQFQVIAKYRKNRRAIDKQINIEK